MIQFTIKMITSLFFLHYFVTLTCLALPSPPTITSPVPSPKYIYTSCIAFKKGLCFEASMENNPAILKRAQFMCLLRDGDFQLHKNCSSRVKQFFTSHCEMKNFKTSLFYLQNRFTEHLAKKHCLHQKNPPYIWTWVHAIK